MITALRLTLAAAAATLALAVVGPAAAQLVAPPADFVPEPPIAAEPHRIEASTPAVTSRLLAEDAERYLEQLGITATTSRSPSSPAPAAAPLAPVPADGGGISRTIKIEAAPAVNASPLFRFRDVTERGAASAPLVPIAERRAAVEAYRQSLAKERAAGR